MALPADNDKAVKVDGASPSTPMQVGTAVADDKTSAPIPPAENVADIPTPTVPIASEEPLGPPPSSPNQSIDGYGDGTASAKESEVSPPKPEGIKTEPAPEEHLSKQTPPVSSAPPPPSPILSSSDDKVKVGAAPKAPIGNSSLGPKPLGFTAQPVSAQAPKPPKMEEKRMEKPELSEAVAKAQQLVREEKKEKPTKEKKKSNGGGKKIIMAVLGFFLLLGGLAAGYYYYSANVQVPEVAEVGGCTNGAYCAGCLNKCVSWETINSYGGGCQQVIDAKCDGGLSGQAQGICNSDYSNPNCVGKAFGHKIDGRYCVWLSNNTPPDGKNQCTLTNNCSSSSGGGCSLQNFGSACGSGGTCTAGGKDNRGWPSCTCSGQSSEAGGTSGGGTIACSGGVASGCGAVPDNIPSYNQESGIGPFPEAGKLVVYYYGMNSEADTSGTDEIVRIHLSYNGSDYLVPVTQLTGGKQRILTDIEVAEGDIVKLTNVEESQQGAQCAPESGPPYYGTGWIPRNSDGTCGTGLAGPPTGGVCTPFNKIDITGAVRWAKDYGGEILSAQCWADWREWPGDYDFNDYFIMFSYEPVDAPSVVCSSVTSDPESINLGDEVTFVCDAQASTADTLDYEFRYRVGGGDYQELSTTNNSASLAIDAVGTYEVQCRACISDGSICSAEWSAAGQ